MQALLRSGSNVQSMLDAHQVAVDAEDAVRSLNVEKDAQFEVLYSCLIVDEPSVHLLPLHFLPPNSEHVVGPSVLHELGVAAKLEYARNRWLDEMVDAKIPSPVPLTAHRLNDGIIALIGDRYGRVIDGSVAAAFYRTLSCLHARHGLSVVLDGRRAGHHERAMSLIEYVDHARARHGPMRAPLDALLLLVGASERTTRMARASWQNWELGVQFYDDALDVEEDFENGNSSWVVSRTFEIIRHDLYGRKAAVPPGPDEFYQRALTEGVVCHALAIAEKFFAAAARQAARFFPTWEAYQRECLNRTASLRKDFERMIAENEKV